jgi:enoyl-CoA hydratase/carnithine racemase
MERRAALFYQYILYSQRRLLNLNRPKALNALNLDMVRIMTPLVRMYVRACVHACE